MYSESLLSSRDVEPSFMWEDVRGWLVKVRKEVAQGSSQRGWWRRSYCQAFIRCRVAGLSNAPMQVCSTFFATMSIGVKQVW